MYEFEGVGQFQLAQEAPDLLLVKVRRPPSGPEIDRDGIVGLVTAELGDSVDVEVLEVDSIDARANGKAAPALVGDPDGSRADTLAS